METVKREHDKEVVMDQESLALEHFSSGYNCAESVLLACCPGYGRNSLPRIATGFGGGIARNGDLCGALAGGILALGLALGRNDSQGSRDPCYPAVDRLYTGFKERFGSTRCRDLLGVNLKTPEGQRDHAAGKHREICRGCVGWAARSTSRLMTEFAPGSTSQA
jgi:C_GCAxxG_C_C family probable redox protein